MMDFNEENFDTSINYKKKKKTAKVFEIGKQLAETSNGLFSPDDWQCRKCGNVNWARRYKCNVCKEAKFPKIEARTGLGGGYNDREIVEYVQREESDEEYDRFGRKRRKRERKVANGEGRGGGEISTDNIPEGITSNDDENVDEDEEEVDLSKYDLGDLEEASSECVSNRIVSASNCNEGHEHFTTQDFCSLIG